MKTTIQNIVAINLIQWYKDSSTYERLSSLPLKIQWVLRKNMKVLEPISNTFNEFKDDLTKKRNEVWFVEGNGRCEKTTDDNGEEILKIKEECLEDFYKYDEELNKQIKEIVEEETEVDLQPMDIEELLELDNIDLNIDDLEMLNAFTLEGE